MSGDHHHRRRGNGNKKRAPRPPLYQRLEQSRNQRLTDAERYAKTFESARKLAAQAESEAKKPKHWLKRDILKPTHGFMRRLFNRKTG